ncbi:SDR family oxidoreductase [Arcticibacterium luteifluviistationis]|uniref:dTDP-4-dehydrorhamnose reductase n=1 Tax=Arcticibacterium luteifluviistationis TaxID=1784714 RepID=A0A2Z4GB71_9BACT|nr:SDR family oxidoreductase [Arcticibacterium luteifluviistationis]AWV98328.1 NAD(P)-dependent oxidoreductase [Arcticibacterium luteifluviistationis]
MKKVLITGSNGLLGQKLVSLLLEEGKFEIIATARGENRLPVAKGYTYQSMDITNQENVDEVMDKFKPDVLIHTAAMTNVDQCEAEKEACWLLNVTATEYLVNACERNSTFLCHLSTDFIFDGSAGPYDELAAANPISFYGWSKLAAEHLITSSSLKWSIARTVLVYGIAHDMSRSNIILWVKKSLEDSKTINVVNDQWRTPTLAEDLAKGCALIAEKEAEGVFNISGKDLLNPYQMAHMTADFFNLDKSYIKEATAATFSQPAKRPPKTGFNIDKAVNELGYNPLSFEEGIAFLAKQIA